jgi:uridine phosphorylase
MPSRLRPTAPLAADAILVGDPGRSLLLAQELLEQPRMSNHARGLWGYSGRTPGGHELTIQATGMGGPSAAIVLADLAKLGVRRAIRVGTCTAVEPGAGLGDLLIPERALAGGGSTEAFGVGPGQAALPDGDLSGAIARGLEGRARTAAVASVDALPVSRSSVPAEAAAADMQTVALFARGRELGIATAAVLIVSETAAGERIDDDSLERASKLAGTAAEAVLSA